MSGQLTLLVSLWLSTHVGGVPVDGRYKPVGLEELREDGVQDGRLAQFVVGVPVPHVDEADGIDLLHAPIDRKNERRRTKNEAAHHSQFSRLEPPNMAAVANVRSTRLGWTV